MGWAYEDVDVVEHETRTTHKVIVKGIVVGFYEDIQTANLVADAFGLYLTSDSASAGQGPFGVPPAELTLADQIMSTEGPVTGKPLPDDLIERILSSTVSREEQAYQAGWNEATAPDAQDEALEEETPEPFRCEGVHDHPGHEWVDDRDGLTYWCRGQDSTDVPPAEGQGTTAHLNDGDVIKAKEPLTLKPADGPSADTAVPDERRCLCGEIEMDDNVVAVQVGEYVHREKDPCYLGIYKAWDTEPCDTYQPCGRGEDHPDHDWIADDGVRVRCAGPTEDMARVSVVDSTDDRCYRCGRLRSWEGHGPEGRNGSYDHSFAPYKRLAHDSNTTDTEG